VLVNNTQIYGYAVSHPIRRGQPLALDTLLGAIPADADAYYIHDVVVLQEMRGRGYPGEEKRFGVTCLVAVYGMRDFGGGLSLRRGWRGM